MPAQREVLRGPRGAVSLLLLASLVGLAPGEVGDFSPCLRFFHRDAPPTGLPAGRPLTPVCQRFRNQYRFASLYDRQRRTPLYSAYLLTPAAGKRPQNHWKYEPQLAFSRAKPEMQVLPKTPDQNVIESQAVLQDYNNSNYTKGHLNPSLHHHDANDRKATFTLTNVVPQKKGSNGGPWARLEEGVRARLEALCLGPAHVITGFLPYASGQRWINDRVAVPEYMWSAYCCPSYHGSLPRWARPFFPTYAAIGRNDRDSGEEIVPVDPTAKGSVRGYDVRRLPLADLEEVLRQRLAPTVSLFQGQCAGPPPVVPPRNPTGCRFYEDNELQ
ncbi:endonuclease domain-containing 1 protein-like [Gadus chalcogrammus]|uniref:endonuclease domain-containing 1 protein-like n=1 Tax=Gadus chalcogrammus TaxID=1042646 RepID=UPI0024C4C99E|nr:endonuclease domain-containing 1 protein-like [Gadus chalcogrammus]